VYFMGFTAGHGHVCFLVQRRYLSSYVTSVSYVLSQQRLGSAPFSHLTVLSFSELDKPDSFLENSFRFLGFVSFYSASA